MSTPGVPPASAPNRRQKRMGPAPFASFEDLSDELESPEDKNATGSVVRLPGIREDITPCSPTPHDQIKTEFIYTGISLIGAPSTPTMTSVPPPPPSQPPLPPTTFTHAKTNLQTPSAPRIDISRASSSSHHDSKDSSPERDMYETHEPQNTKMGLGFKEEGTLDLRSSTEELDFQDADAKQKLRHHPLQQQRPLSPLNDSYHSHNRKDSQSSELGLLCISGRTSRLSSIGSQGSAHSRISNASHLSIISGQSALSRSPSPHKMLLETSFCGTKPRKDAKTSQELDGTKVNEDLEKVLLQRNHDMTRALFAEGISMDQVEEIKIRTKPPEKVKPKIKPRPNMQTIKSEVTITVDKPTELPKQQEDDSDIVEKPKLPKRIVSASGVEYIYIPLKGPLPVEPPGTASTSNTARHHSERSSTTSGKTKVRETKSASLSSKGSKTREPTTKSKSASPSPMLSHRQYANDEPKYIRIKLKPDHMYDDVNKIVVNMSTTKTDIQKPTRLDLNQAISEVESIALANNKLETRIEVCSQERKHSALDEIKIVKPVNASPNLSPMLPRNLVEVQITDSKTPSPTISRKSSFASLFRSRENISPETPTAITSRRKADRSRSRSKSRERSTKSSNESIDSKGKPISTVLALFKTKKSGQTELPNLATLCNLESKYSSTELPKKKKSRENPLQAESIRIPLHSPTYYEHKNLLIDQQKSSQDSQDTVIEVKTSKPNSCSISPVVPSEEIVNNIPNQTAKPEYKARQSSTSSENIVFSTKLGSNNELFTTKLPKSPKEKSKPIENQQEIKVSTSISEHKLYSPPKEATIVSTPKGYRKESPPKGPRMVTPTKESRLISPLKESRIITPLKETRIISSPQQMVSIPKESRIITPPKEIKLVSPPKEIKLISPLKDIKPVEMEVKQKEVHLEKSVTEVFSSEPQQNFTELKNVRKLSKKLISRDFSRDSFDKYTTDHFASTSKETVIVNTKSFELEHKSFEAELDAEVAENNKQEFATFSTDFDSNFENTPIETPRQQKSIPREDSETDSETNFDEEIRGLNKRDDECVEIERKGLVFQTDSFDDEIPYIPTTLPQERTMGVAIVPVNQRSTFEMKTCSINRPRSTTPIHLSCLEQFCEEQLEKDLASNQEKIKITLPGEEGVQKRVKSPKKPSNAVTQFDFIQKRKDSIEDVTEMIRKEAQDIQQKEWVNFEEIPERRKPPKRIQTIPSRSNIEVPEANLHQHNVIYTYVNPEDCKCECHHDLVGKPTHSHAEDETMREDELPLLEDDAIEDDTKTVDRIKLDVTILDRRSIVSDSSIDLSTAIGQPDANGVDHSLHTPFTSDLGISSNRSSIISQDDTQSPDTDSPNAFPKM